MQRFTQIKFYVQKVKSQLHCDIMMFCINTSLLTQGQIVIIFQIWSDSELAAHL